MKMTLSYDRPPFNEHYDPDSTVFLTADGPVELDTCLDAIHAEAAAWPMPVYVTISQPSDHEGTPSLSIAIGRDHSILQWSRDLPGPHGDWSERETLWSWNGSHDEHPGFQVADGPSPGTEPAWRVIPVHQARAAARHFAVNGQRPPQIQWRVWVSTAPRVA